MRQFSRVVQETLVASGWQEGRHVDITAMVDLLSQSHMPVHLAARTFLTEFGGLQVRSIIPDGGRKLEYWADFDVRLALTWIGARDRQLLGDLLGPGLSPIGVTCGGTLWISERSEIVGEYLLFDTVTRSRSVEEAFERLFAGRLPDYETYTVDDNGTPVGVSIAPWASDEGDKT